MKRKVVSSLRKQRLARRAKRKIIGFSVIGVALAVLVTAIICLSVALVKEKRSNNNSQSNSGPDSSSSLGSSSGTNPGSSISSVPSDSSINEVIVTQEFLNEAQNTFFGALPDSQRNTHPREDEINALRYQLELDAGDLTVSEREQLEQIIIDNLVFQTAPFINNIREQYDVAYASLVNIATTLPEDYYGREFVSHIDQYRIDICKAKKAGNEAEVDRLLIQAYTEIIGFRSDETYRFNGTSYKPSDFVQYGPGAMNYITYSENMILQMVIAKFGQTYSISIPAMKLENGEPQKFEAYIVAQNISNIPWIIINLDLYNSEHYEQTLRAMSREQLLNEERLGNIELRPTLVGTDDAYSYYGAALQKLDQINGVKDNNNYSLSTAATLALRPKNFNL